MAIAVVMDMYEYSYSCSYIGPLGY
jgi:hypothetical protein